MAAGTQEALERRLELVWLADFYGGLLTEKQREVLQLSCGEDMTLAEIAQETGISRQAVHEMLSRASARLFDLEDRLHMAARFRRAEKILQECKAAVRQGDAETACQMLDALMDGLRRDEW